jgi:hypothetical protein
MTYMHRGAWHTASERDYQQRPTTSRGPPPAFKYQVHACIAATSTEIARMIADSEARTRRLEQDLATKRQEEASKR